MAAIKLSDHFTYSRLLRFTFPSIVMMVFTSLYTIVDGIFVSNLAGEAAFASLNLIWPVIGMIGAFGFMIGAGGSALVSKTLGEQRKEKACEYFTLLVLFEIVCGMAISLAAAWNIRPIARLLGATDALMQDCVNYGFILLAGQTFFFLSTSFQSFMIVAEKPKAGLAITLACGFSNMLLDYVFIAVFGLGIFGAALATALNWALGALIPLVFFCKKTSTVHFVRPRWHSRALVQACLNGSSEMVTNLSASFVLMLYNFELMHLIGSDGVNAYGVIQYLAFLFMAVFLGYTMAVSPLISYQYGAGDHAQLRNLLEKSLVILMTFSVAMFATAQISAVPLSGIFVSYSEKLMEITVHGIRIYALAFLMAGFNIFFSGFFTALNNGPVSALLSFCRTLVFQAGCTLLLPLAFGLDGVWAAAPVSEAVSMLVGLIFMVRFSKRYGY